MYFGAMRTVRNTVFCDTLSKKQTQGPYFRLILKIAISVLKSMPSQRARRYL